MILIWNRKEVFVGNSLKMFNQARFIISANGIQYKYKVIDSSSPNFFGSSSRARTGTFGINSDYIKTYYIYVHKNDYNEVQSLLRN